MYTDDQGNFGYWHPGNHVVRAPGVDIRLPQDGTGGSEWRGLLPIQKVPHAVNFSRGWLANWNNQPAAGWARERGHPALDNVLDLEDALDPEGGPLTDPFGGEINADGLLDFDDANANLRYAAFKHHRDTYFSEFLSMPADLESDVHKQAAEEARSWNGFLNDSDDDGLVDSAGKTIIDRWVQHMQMLAFQDDLGELQCWEENACFTNESLLWHVLKTNDLARLGHDWLGELSPEELAAQAFASAVDELSEEHESQDPSTWKQEIALEHYQRLNADLAIDLAEGEASDNSDDSGRPGDVADHIQMDRGTYNHIVAYLNPPSGTELGNADSMAGSVIPPGQSGFINQLGQEDPNYESQLDLYVEWRYKPMPTTLEEALAVATSDQTITRPES
jgi:penicillin amidase